MAIEIVTVTPKGRKKRLIAFSAIIFSIIILHIVEKEHQESGKLMPNEIWIKHAE